MKLPIARPRVSAVAVAAALLLAACADDTTGGAQDDAPSLTTEDSPLSAYMSSVWGRDAGAEAEAKIRGQEAVAQCMADQGFDYVIPEPPAPAPFEVGFDMEQMDSESWIAQNGFGIAMSMEAAVAASDTASDPNADYVASLSDASKGQYYLALYGAGGEGLSEEELATYVPTAADQGCWGLSAADGVTRDYMADPAFEEISAGLMKLHSAVAADPVVVGLDEAWADCMADAGFTGHTARADVSSGMWDAYDAVYYPAGTSADGAPAAPDPQELAAVKEEEISLALADHACVEEVDYDDAFQAVVYAAEEQFIVDNKALLDSLIAEYGS